MEVYQKNFPDFICGNPTSREVWGQDEETETWPNGITQEEEVQTTEPHDLKSGATQEEAQPERPHDLRRRGQEEIKEILTNYVHHEIT